jgi:hypothetical protein
LIPRINPGACTTFEIRLSLMLESLNTKLLDGGFRDSEAGLVSVIEVKIFCPPKGCLVVDILRESECQKLPATLFTLLILI